MGPMENNSHECTTAVRVRREEWAPGMGVCLSTQAPRRRERREQEEQQEKLGLVLLINKTLGLVH